MNDEKVKKAARCLKALAHPVRLKILAVLQEGPRNVQEINQEIPVNQSNLSQHLNRMLDRGILLAERRGNYVYYSADDPDVFQLLRVIRKVFCKEEIVNNG